MLKDEATRTLNRLARESLHFLGSANSSAFDDFLEPYFCGDDPANDSPGKHNVLPRNTLPYGYQYR